MNQHSPRYFRTETGALAEGDSSVSLPRVTVLVTCFNYGRFIGEALDSVSAQSYENFNCIVVDDASTDDSFTTVEQWISNKRDGRFRLIRNQRNLGQMGSLVAGLAGTEGEFVALLDADDIWFPDFLTRHIEVHLNRAQSVGASCSDLVQIDATGRALAGSSLPPAFLASNLRKKSSLLAHSDILAIGQTRALGAREGMEVRYIPADLGYWYWSVASGMVLRRPLVELLIPADTTRLRLGADFYLMALGHALTGSLVIETALGAYRRHGGNNFASLPIVGSPGLADVAATVKNLQNVHRAMLDHILGASDRLGEAFSPGLVGSRARTLLRLFLQQGITIDDPRLDTIVGRQRVRRDRMRAKIGFLRRRLK
jgi:glycosyltransferase involved in cell wall biosynthesis